MDKILLKLRLKARGKTNTEGKAGNRAKRKAEAKLRPKGCGQKAAAKRLRPNLAAVLALLCPYPDQNLSLSKACYPMSPYRSSKLPEGGSKTAGRGDQGYGTAKALVRT